MDRACLLVIDKSPDRAQLVKSFLRNAGIAIRVVNASSFDELEDNLKNKSHFLTLIGTQLPPFLSITQVLQLTEQYSTPVAMQVDPTDISNFQSALANFSVLVINAEENDQLMKVVRKHISGGTTALDYGRLQNKLNEVQDRYELLLDSARDAIAYIHEGLHVYANHVYLNLLQVNTLDDIEDLSLLEVMVAEKGPGLKSLLRGMSKGNFPEVPLPFTIHTHGGTELQADLTFAPAMFNGEACIQIVACAQDAHMLLNQELTTLRKTDPLTKMINRKTFGEELSHLVNDDQKDEDRQAILYIEPDGMSELQRDLDMESIDAYILDLANVISGCIEEVDVPARISDFGFAVLIRRNEKSALKDTGERIIKNYAHHIIDLGDQTMSASCSIGLATLGSLTNEPKDIINQARKAFKKAARKGNTLIRYKPALTTVQASETDRGWVERIQYALSNHDIYTMQQSIVDLEGENEGFFDNRTFLREDENDTHAHEFMPSAEQSDLGSAIDRYVIPRLLKAIAGTGDRHIIALSSNSILDFSFPSWFEQQLKETGTEASQLVVQISAIAAESNLLPTRRLIEELQNMGCGIVLSEFDNARRTLQVLDHLPVNMIKLRTGLARGLSSNSDNQEIIRAVVSAVRSQNIMIIADEVKDASDLAVLWQCGVKLVTGDFLNEAPQVVGQ